MELDSYVVCSREDCSWAGRVRDTGDDCADPKCPACGHDCDEPRELGIAEA